MQTTTVAVVTTDMLLRTGANVMLSGRKDVRVVPQDEARTADVVVLIEAKVTRNGLTQLDLGHDRERACVIVTDHFREDDLLAAVFRDVTAILPLRETDAAQLIAAVLGAREGLARFPPLLQRRLLSFIRDIDQDVLRPNGLTVAGLTERECDVLRLLTAGLSTGEIAARLSYSERTVKNVLYRVMKRHGLRNRAHVAAYAVRACVC
ncbi:LuxR family transcriptional regulator [Kibdelosporangium persicum]|uniref:HTH-type quorum sensing-dependent transcriptional regulator VjbR n=1 Tax=Kibdelosporangium persicum TaxID=2698649 RepID=A0ABX2F7Y6_9PSEU|nr:response regulator transcription factor [Kibdelosporangium persicum]NRN67259.1 HTH-type quorum sensing-dependent transcriptional regulator VjbR [Kibdelosporangium persicum]